MFELPFPKGTCVSRVENYYQQHPDRFTQQSKFDLKTYNYKLDAGCFELWQTSLYYGREFEMFYKGINASDGIYHECWREQLFKTLFIRTTVEEEKGFVACDFIHAHKTNRIHEAACRESAKDSDPSIIKGIVMAARQRGEMKSNDMQPVGRPKGKKKTGKEQQKGKDGVADKGEDEEREKAKRTQGSR
jgi:hypothetical protein